MQNPAGNQEQASKEFLLVKLNKMCLIPQIMSCENTHEILTTAETH